MFCVSRLINCMLEADEEFICMDFHFTLRDDGMRATFQLLHMILEVCIYHFLVYAWSHNTLVGLQLSLCYRTMFGWRMHVIVQSSYI